MRSEAQKKAESKYVQSEKGKIAHAHHAQTPKGKIAKTHYAQSEKGKIAGARGSAHYAQSEKGKITDAFAKAKRKRDLGYNPHNNWFNGCNGHHLNKKDVLFIPKRLHQSIRHKQNDLESMQRMNGVAFEWLCTQEIL